MERKLDITGIGLAIVDKTIYLGKDGFPQEITTPGGVTPNIVYTLLNLLPGSSVRLIASVGDDILGAEYANGLGVLSSDLQKVNGKKTGHIYSNMVHNGEHLVVEASYGAARSIKLPDIDLLAYTGLLITDIFTVLETNTQAELLSVLTSPDKKCLVGLNLGGVTPGLTKEELDGIKLYKPSFVFGNRSEFDRLSDNVADLFPEAYLTVTTNGSGDIVVRFKQEFLKISSHFVDSDRVTNETGAGDTFMGTMLAMLLSENIETWTKRDIINAARIASYASSLVIQSKYTHLLPEELLKVQEFIRKYNN